MPNYTLLSSTMDILVPAERAPGIHVSDIVTDYAIRLRLLLPDGSHAGDREGDEASPGQTEAMECGLALEWARARRLEADRPGGWLDLGTQYTDGIAWTPDAYDLLGWTDRAGVVHPPNCPWECKGTWMSVARGPGDPKLWRYEVQTGAYLYGCGRAFGTPHLTAVLDVTYFRGSYKDDQLVAHRRWRIDWEERPLLHNWIMLRTHGEVMEKAGWKPGMVLAEDGEGTGKWVYVEKEEQTKEASSDE